MHVDDSVCIDAVCLVCIMYQGQVLGGCSEYGERGGGEVTYV